MRDLQQEFSDLVVQKFLISEGRKIGNETGAENADLIDAQIVDVLNSENRQLLKRTAKRGGSEKRLWASFGGACYIELLEAARGSGRTS